MGKYIKVMKLFLEELKQKEKEQIEIKDSVLEEDESIPEEDEDELGDYEGFEKLEKEY